MKDKQLLADYERYISLVKLEPGLADLLEQARERSLKKIDNKTWYDEFKPTMYHLVGMGARNPKLTDSSDYDAVYSVLYYTLTGQRIR